MRKCVIKTYIKVNIKQCKPSYTVRKDKNHYNNFIIIALQISETFDMKGSNYAMLYGNNKFQKNILAQQNKHH